MRYESISALEAIKRSERQDEIVHVAGGPQMHADLHQDCDGTTDAGTDSDGRKVTEYWGDTWRVHVHG